MSGASRPKLRIAVAQSGLGIDESRVRVGYGITYYKP
jgi:hypothetical protein